MHHLIDANALIALMDDQHADHDRTHRFFARRRFAVSPQVQLAALRHLTRPEIGPELPVHEARRRLQVTMNVRGKFVPDDLDAAKLPFGQVAGHRQWNDHYLCELARRHGLKLATCEDAIVKAYPAAAVLIPE